MPTALQVRLIMPDTMGAGRAAAVASALPRVEVPYRMRFVILYVQFFLAIGTAVAAEISGILTEVHDGDTITLTNWRHTYRIRLVDIDATELTQTRGQDSRINLFHLCALKRAVAETAGEDRFGRTLATLTCADVNANAEMVRRKWAWVFVRFAPSNSPLFALEREARLEKRGPWAVDAPVPPWASRTQHIGLLEHIHWHVGRLNIRALTKYE